MRINSVPGVKCFRNNKKVLRAQSMVWHFVRHPVVRLHPTGHRVRDAIYSNEIKKSTVIT